MDKVLNTFVTGHSCETGSALICMYRKSLNKNRGVYFLSEVFKKASI